MDDRKFKTVIVWFRRDLRVHDNTALFEAYRQASYVIPLFVLDEPILKRPDTGPCRVIFLLDALGVLDQNLQKLGGRLIVRRGSNPDEVLAALDDYRADAIFFNRDYEPYALDRDKKVVDGAKERGREAVSFKDQVMFEPEEICSAAGTHFTVFSPYQRTWMKLPQEPPRRMPSKLDVPDEMKSEPIPTAFALGVSTSQKFDCGGENAALKLLGEFTEYHLPTYYAGRNDLAADSTSKLSRHFHFGTIGIRTAIDAAKHVRGSEKWISELVWREFYTQILYYYPHVEKGPLRTQFANIAWSGNDSHFKAWCEGRTGYPLVDAAMRQLNAEAWMHNRARMVAASFLTKDLLINWQEGERYFMKMLVDGDLAANNGGWQWVAGTGTDPQPYFRIFNPILQSEKFDPKGEYIRRYVPELANVKDVFIHSPWKMSMTEQRESGCVIGKQYPAPVVDHFVQREITLAAYKRAAGEPADEPGARSKLTGTLEL